MAKLTRKCQGITSGFTSGYKRDDLIQKLGHIEYQGEKLVGGICDHVCRYMVDAEPEEMDTICEACPVTGLMDLID